MANISKSTYEYYKSKKHIDYIKHKEQEDNRIYERIKIIYDENKGRLGYIRINLALNKEMLINQKRTQRIMKEHGLKGIQGNSGKFHTYKGDNGEKKRNLLLSKVVDEVKHTTKYERDFSTSKPNEKWTTDVSEFKITSGKLYLSPILDMYDTSIISYDISRSPNFEQTKRMLNRAFSKFKTLDELIFHSDQGWQYQMLSYQKELKDRGIKQSFSRKGNCMDNGLMECFFGIMKNEMFYGHEKEFKTLEELQNTMIEYIDYYNNLRINKKRKGLSPMEYREQYYSLKGESIVQL